MTVKRRKEQPQKNDKTVSQAKTRTSSSANAFGEDLPLRKWLGLIFISYYIILFLVIFYFDGRLPEPKPANAPLEEFSEARSRTHLYALTDAGARLTGSYNNEVTATKYILDTIRDIKLNAKPGWQLDVDIQRPSGCFDINFLDGMTNCYEHVTNILIRLWADPNQANQKNDNYDDTTAPKDAILISSHYDSSIGTVAASDNVANVANMIEILRAFTQRPSLEKITNNDGTTIYNPVFANAIIFLFNGAEETILQASHGFITQHKWANSIRAFMNLEGAGGTGREVLFQTGPKHAWLANAYAESAVYPFGAIIKQEVFQSGIIPSDTDFRVFRDYGGIPGLDFAYVSNGYIYHTEYDTASRVLNGSLQRCGENILATLYHLGATEDLHLMSVGADSIRANPPPPSSKTNSKLPVHHLSNAIAVYYDFLGLFMVVYSQNTAFILNWSSLIFIFIYAYTAGRWRAQMQTRVKTMLYGMGMATLASVTVAAFLMVTGHALSWFAHPILLFPLFACPALLAMGQVQRNAFHHDEDDQKSKQVLHTQDPFVNYWEREDITFFSGLIIPYVLLFIFSIFGLGATFAPLNYCIFPVIARIIGVKLVPYVSPVSNNKNKTTSHGGWFFVLCYLIGLLFPSLILGNLFIFMFKFFVPIMGRAGPFVPADIVIAVLLAISISLLSILSISLIHLLSDSHWKVLRGFLLLLTIGSVVVALSVAPFSPNHPKRILLVHTQRFFYPPFSDSYNDIQFDSYKSNYPPPAYVSSSDHAHHAKYVKQLTSEQIDQVHISGRGVTDHSVWTVPLDWFNFEPVTKYVQEKGWHPEPYHCDTGKDIFCYLPWYLPVTHFINGGMFLEAPSPASEFIPDSNNLSEDAMPPLRVRLLEQTYSAENNTRRLHFHATGPDHMTLYVNGNSSQPPLVAWSFSNPASTANFPYQYHVNRDEYLGQPTPVGVTPKPTPSQFEPSYFVYFASGVHPDHADEPVPTHTLTRSWNFWLEFEGTVPNRDGTGGKTVELALAAHYFNGTTKSINALTQTIPEWTSIVPWIAVYKRFIF